MLAAEGGCRLVWIADLLPHAAAANVAAMMDDGMTAAAAALGSLASRDPA